MLAQHTKGSLVALSGAHGLTYMEVGRGVSSAGLNQLKGVKSTGAQLCCGRVLSVVHVCFGPGSMMHGDKQSQAAGMRALTWCRTSCHAAPIFGVVSA